MRLTGTFGLSTSIKCQPIDSPSRSSSVAIYSSSTPLSKSFNSLIWVFLSLGTTYKGLKPSSTLTPIRAQDLPLNCVGISLAEEGRSRT